MLKNADRITLKGMQFFSKSGLYPFEREMGQPLEVDVTCYLDLRQACKTDESQNTVDYEQVYEKVRGTVLERRYNILESICERIAMTILEDRRILKVSVSCRKPRVRLPGILEYAEVSIEREQSQS